MIEHGSTKKYSNKKTILFLDKQLTKNGSTSLTRSSNGPFFYYDNSQNDKKIEDAEKIYNMNSLRQDGIGYLRIPVIYGSHASFCPISDLHFATSQPKIMYNLFNNYLNNTLTDVFFHGDLIQMPTEGNHFGEGLESRIKGDEESQILFKKYINKISNKCKGATGGTHDSPEFASRLKGEQFEILEPYFEQYGIPYFPNSMIIEYLVPVIKNSKIVDYASCWVVVMHCYGKPGSKKLDSAVKTYEEGQGVVERFNSRTGLNIIPDYIMGGHFHANSDIDYPFTRKIYDSKGEVIGNYIQTIRVRSNATIQDSNSSCFNRSFPEVLIPNYTQYDVHFEVNDNFNPKAINKYPKYKLISTELPILNKMGEVSLIAQDYMKKRTDIDYKTIIESENKYLPLKRIFNNFNDGLNNIQ